ncbi:MAG: hypothetical protein JRG67_11420, partial [Deltaproteobacteria bacterium]|nr:hypothetical protein [Deltaproteobacteria bacterium]
MVRASHQDPGLIADGVARFVPPDVDPSTLPPSFALVEPLPALGAVPDSWRTVPQFDRTVDGLVAIIPIDAGTSL